jgi:hypothetical protein
MLSGNLNVETSKPVSHPEGLEYKIDIFKVIYSTLRTCQDNISLLKTNFLEGKENLAAAELAKKIEIYCVQNPNSRTAKAWELTKKHYQNFNIQNIVLFNEIYQFVRKSKTYFGSTFFSSFNSPGNLTEEKINNPDYYKDKIVCNIKFWLEISMRELENYRLFNNKPQ